MDSTVEQEELRDNITEWMSSFSPSSKLDNNSIRDCRRLAEVLHYIDAEFFTSDWVNDFSEYSTLPRVKAKSLTKLLQRIKEYYEVHTEHNLDRHPRWNVDELKFMDDEEVEELVSVLTLIVGVAYLGRRSVEFVTSGQSLPTSIQNALVFASKEVMENSGRHTRQEVRTHGNGVVENSAGREALLKELEEVNADRDRLESELKKRMNDIYSLTNGNTAEAFEKKIETLVAERSRFEDSAIELEQERDMLREKVDTQALDIRALNDQVELMLPFESENRKLRDELDELRVSESERARLQDQIDQMKRKMKSMQDEKNELGLLREKVQHYLRQSVEMEEEKTKNKNLRTQVASSKAYLKEKGAENEQQQIRIHQLELQLAEMKCSLATCEKRREVTEHEKNELQYKLNKNMLDTSGENLQAELGSQLENGTDEERVLRLELENEELKSRVREMEELEIARGEWQTAKNRIRELESHLAIGAKKRAELEEQMAELEKQLEEAKTAGPNPLQTSTELRVQAEQFSLEQEQWQERLDKAEKRLFDVNQDLSTARSELETKDKELADEKERMHNYMEKARLIIVDQERQAQTATEGGLSRHEFDSLRKEIEQKDRRIKALEEERERTTTMNEQEQRLITTAYYSMGERQMDLMRSVNATDSARERSLLTRQRQASQAAPRKWQQLFALVAMVLAVIVYIIFTMSIFSIGNKVSIK